MDPKYWEEYDSAAHWCARRGLKPSIGDPLPNLMSAAVHDEINEHPEDFQRRVSETAYALACERSAAIHQKDVNTDTRTADYFGDLISVYTRAQAIEDGVLVDVSNVAREAGIVYPTALTRGVWETCVTVPTRADGTPVPCQDEPGRLWDVLWMTRLAIRMSPAGRTELPVKLRVRQREGHRNVWLKSVCGPGDNAEPVITIMLPDED